MLVIIQFTAHKQIYIYIYSCNNNIMATTAVNFLLMAVKKKTSTTSTEDSLLEYHCLECSSACSIVCLSSLCHHAQRCGRLHASLSVWSRLERRRGRRRDCRLEIVVYVVDKSPHSSRHLDWNRHVAPAASIEPVDRTDYVHL